MWGWGGAYQHPAVEADAEGQVKSGDHQQSPEPIQQERDKANLEHVGVEHHQQYDDHVEQDGNVLDAVMTNSMTLYVILVSDELHVLKYVRPCQRQTYCKTGTFSE